MAPAPEVAAYDSNMESSNQQQPDKELDIIDVEAGGLGGTTTTRDGKYLRWARISKEVEVKEAHR